MTISVVFSESRKATDTSLLAVLPVELPTLTQWQRKFQLTLPVTVTFGSATYSQISNLYIVGSASFTPTGVMNRVSGKMSGYIYRSN